jgi:TonB family protein
MKTNTVVSLVATFLLASVVIGQERRLPREGFDSAPEFFMRRYVSHKVDPIYPAEAKEKGIQGLVLVFVWFDREGGLIEVKPLASPDELLSNSVVEAVKQWRLKAHNDFDPNTEYLGELRFVFTLTDGVGKISDAPEDEQQKVSPEYRRELDRIKKARGIETLVGTDFNLPDVMSICRMGCSATTYQPKNGI